MRTYAGTKVVKATPMDRREYNEYRGWALPADENGDDEGYLVEYVDGGKPNHRDHSGYISWSPKEQFDNAYRENAGIPFGMAVELMKLGKRVARAGWNGKGMWLGLHKEGGAFIREECGTEITYADYIVMKTADNKLVPWLASQSDVLAEDWMVLP